MDNNTRRRLLAGAAIEKFSRPLIAPFMDACEAAMRDQPSLTFEEVSQALRYYLHVATQLPGPEDGEEYLSPHAGREWMAERKRPEDR